MAEKEEQKVYRGKNWELRQRIDQASRQIIWRRRDLELHVRRLQKKLPS